MLMQLETLKFRPRLYMYLMSKVNLVLVLYIKVINAREVPDKAGSNLQLLKYLKVPYLKPLKVKYSDEYRVLVPDPELHSRH